ncbi:hypothetical protein A8H27_17725 [Burkholderia cenocepacia]|uniref:hypothetical protein n=1 Tax=Burkholderia sp. 9775_39 TaxID=2751185 RepID=UPI000C9C4BD2|nr:MULTISPECIES: hypothetical protein [Burkholderia]MBG0881573.1 hypothetical protein [Burkholderia sp. 9775_39]MBG0888160.1 hypothetical protein [Burkholderia sp. 9773_38]PNE99660.1 hypothetical protein A8H27_17725 [Burkholderia cenocepacia]RSC44936.1 hypothetical protein EGT44_03055 [Burkholderia cenocepacia]HDR9870697.1 hypothetical protein [Burkholderia cenocepacia]
MILENISSNPVDGRRVSASQNFLRRVKGINRLFAITVLAPTIVATLYYSVIASDVYVSESRFVVRSAAQKPQLSVVGALLSGGGFSRATDDTYPVIDYIQSRDALRELNENNYIYDNYSKQGDFVSRFHTSFDDSFESLWKYYGKNVVNVMSDPTSGITTLRTRAYTSTDAEKINSKLLHLSERLINRMNDRAAKDTVQFAQRQVADAAQNAKAAAAAVAAYRNSHSLFDPDRQSALRLQQVTALQAQLFSAQTQLSQLLSISPQNPQIPALKTTIQSIQKQIDVATGAVAGTKDSLSQKASDYERLQLDSQFADKQLASAMAALENARGEAERKQLYLEELIEPNTPDIAIEPQRIRGIATVFALGLVCWGCLSLLLASIREHRN